MRTYTLTLDIPETIDPDEARALCAEALRDAVSYPDESLRHPFVSPPIRGPRTILFKCGRCGESASDRIHFDQLTGEAL